MHGNNVEAWKTLKYFCICIFILVVLVMELIFSLFWMRVKEANYICCWNERTKESRMKALTECGLL